MKTLEIEKKEETSFVSTAEIEHRQSINAYYDSPAILLFEQMASQQIHLGYWDERYPDVTMDQAARRLTQVVIDQIEIPQDAYFLDIGCGCGQPALEIVKQKQCFVEGITINPQQKAKAEALARSEKAGSKASFSLGDAASLPYIDEQFHGALMFESIHHIGHQQALSEAWRVIRPGASILIADGVVLRDSASRQAACELAETFVAKSLVTEGQLVEQCYDAGFEQVEVLDLTKAIQPTWRKLMERSIKDKERIISLYGSDFFESLVSFWEQMRNSWSANARYLIVKAVKPLTKD